MKNFKLLSNNVSAFASDWKDETFDGDDLLFNDDAFETCFDCLKWETELDKFLELSEIDYSTSMIKTSRSNLR